MTQLFANNASTLTTNSLLVGTTTINITSGDGALFPNPVDPDYFLVTLHTPDFGSWEVVKVGTNSTDTFTVVRGHEGTAQAWDAGTIVSANLTKDTLVQLQTATATAQTAADDAQTDATDALNQLAQGGTAGASVHRQLQISYSNWDANVNADASAQQMVCICLEDGAINIYADKLNPYRQTSWTSGSFVDQDYPMNIGYTIEGANKCQVFLDGVKLRLVESSQLLGFDGPEEGWMWLGHKWIHIWPQPVGANGLIEIIGFGDDDWTVPNTQITAFTYLLGGRNSNNTDTNTNNKFRWATHTRQTFGSNPVSYPSYDGSGGTTDGTNGRVFGGNNNAHDNHWAKMAIATETWTSFLNSLAHSHKNTGCGTSSTNSYIFGAYDGAASWDYITKVVHSTDADSVLSATCTAGYVRGDAASNASQTFGMFVPGFATSNTWKNKLTYSSETVAATNTGSANFNNPNYKGFCTFYDDIGYLAETKKINFATEVWSDTALNFGSNAFTQTTQHEVFCDGGTYMVSKNNKMMYPTETVVHYVANDVNLASTRANFKFIGVFSDAWGPSK